MPEHVYRVCAECNIETNVNVGMCMIPFFKLK